MYYYYYSTIPWYGNNFLQNIVCHFHSMYIFITLMICFRSFKKSFFVLSILHLHTQNLACNKMKSKPTSVLTVSLWPNRMRVGLTTNWAELLHFSLKYFTKSAVNAFPHTVKYSVFFPHTKITTVFLYYSHLLHDQVWYKLVFCCKS